MGIGNLENNEILGTNQWSQELNEEEIVKSIKLKLERLLEDLTESQSKVEILQRKEEEMQEIIDELQISKE